jgi:hypothetical protein
MSDEEEERAKAALESALRTYYETVEPGVYLADWVIVSHKLTTELERDNASAVSLLIRTSQPFAMTRGLLDVALTAERNGSWRDADG